MQVLARRRRLEWQQRSPSHHCSIEHLRTGKVRHGDRTGKAFRDASARGSVGEQRTGCLKARREPRRIGFTDLSATDAPWHPTGWAAYGKVTPAACVDALARPDAADAALVDPGANRMPQSNAPRSLCVLRHRREHTGVATGPSGCGALLAQDAEQPELARGGLVEAIPADQGAVSVVATKAVSPLLGAASYRRVVNQLLTSVVREIRTLRSVGAGERATAPGHPVVVSHHDPYSDRQLRLVSEFPNIRQLT